MYLYDNGHSRVMVFGNSIEQMHKISTDASEQLVELQKQLAELILPTQTYDEIIKDVLTVFEQVLQMNTSQILHDLIRENPEFVAEELNRWAQEIDRLQTLIETIQPNDGGSLTIE